MAQLLALVFDSLVEKPFYWRKTSLVVGGTRTQSLADSMTIAASTLDHCAIIVCNLYIWENCIVAFKPLKDRINYLMSTTYKVSF